MIGYPLDSHVEYDANGTPIYDRAITSAPLRKLYKSLFSDGVMPNPSTNMQVSAGDGMNVIIQPGFAMCNGCLKLEEAQRTLAVQASSTAYDRIDTVVLRLNDNDSERICDFYILEGTPAISPVRPTLTRTESIWEIGLADLFIAKNSTLVSNQRITDTRYETKRCGIVSSVSKFDTETLYQQIRADLAGFKSEEQAEFMAWFKEIRNQLSEDAAGNLQNQIGSLPSLVTDIKDSLVGAINWIANKLSTLANKIGENDISGISDGTITGAIASQNETLCKAFNPRGNYTGNIDELCHIKDNGVYWVTTANASGNQPEIPHYYLIVMMQADYSGVQLAFRHDGAIFKVRGYANGQWYEWIEWASANTLNTEILNVKRYHEAGYYYKNSDLVQLIAGSNQKIYLNTGLNAFNTNGYFELSDGGIKCLKNGVVKVNASIEFTNLSKATYLATVIYKNSTNLKSKKVGSEYDVCVDLYNHPVVVSAGDVIYLYGYCEGAASVKGETATRLEIEYVQV